MIQVLMLTFTARREALCLWRVNTLSKIISYVNNGMILEILNSCFSTIIYTLFTPQPDIDQKDITSKSNTSVPDQCVIVFDEVYMHAVSK